MSFKFVNQLRLYNNRPSFRRYDFEIFLHLWEPTTVFVMQQGLSECLAAM